MNDMLTDKRLFSGTFWMPDEKTPTINGAHLRAVSRMLERQGRKITYFRQPADAPDAQAEAAKAEAAQAEAAQAEAAQAEAAQVENTQAGDGKAKKAKAKKAKAEKAKAENGKADARDAKEEQFHGYTDVHSLSQEPLGLYIRMLLGDGFYYANLSDGTVYLLIVSQGVIVPGTDDVISAALFNQLLAEHEKSEYRDLPLRELNESHWQMILKHYHTGQHQLRRSRLIRFGIIVLVLLVLISIPLFFFMMG